MVGHIIVLPWRYTMLTKGAYSNCLAGALYLYLRGKVKRAAVVSSHAWFVPGHIVVETKRGNFLHFKYLIPQNPLYFKGVFEPVGRSEVTKRLEEEDRKVLCVVNGHLFFILGSIILTALFIPWCLYWPIEALWRIGYDIFTLGKRRINKLVYNYIYDRLGD